jgi:hypothetical protein
MSSTFPAAASSRRIEFPWSIKIELQPTRQDSNLSASRRLKARVPTMIAACCLAAIADPRLALDGEERGGQGVRVNDSGSEEEPTRYLMFKKSLNWHLAENALIVVFSDLKLNECLTTSA